MNQYFFNITKEEKENILDKHKHLYDGYVTEYAKGSNHYPLYVQDMANDKNGITVNNKGDVGVYRNQKINEMRFDGKSTGLFQEEESELGPPLDMIADKEDDVKHGTVDFDGNIENFDLGDIIPFSDGEEDEVIIDLRHDDMDENDFELDVENPIEVLSKIQESLDMFKRFKKYN